MIKFIGCNTEAAIRNGDAVFVQRRDGTWILHVSNREHWFASTLLPANWFIA